MKFSGINGLKKVLFPKAQTKKKKKDGHANCTTQNNKPDKIGGLPKTNQKFVHSWLVFTTISTSEIRVFTL